MYAIRSYYGNFLDYNGGAGCHRDNGTWKRLWSTDADTDFV